MSRKTHCAQTFKKPKGITPAMAVSGIKRFAERVVFINVEVLLPCLKLNTLDLCLLNMASLSQLPL